MTPRQRCSGTLDEAAVTPSWCLTKIDRVQTSNTDRRSVAVVWRAIAAGLAAIALPLVGSARALASTYYVCSSCANALDANSGVEEARPWRTIAKVDKTRLEPGDVVLLMGTFGENEPEYEKAEDGEIRVNKLIPDASGTALRSNSFGSYGSGAILTWGVFIPGDLSWLRIEHLTIDGSDHGGATTQGTQGIAGAAAGHDNHITVLANRVENVLAGIGAHAATDTTWVVADNRIKETGGSGIEVGNTKANTTNTAAPNSRSRTTALKTPVWRRRLSGKTGTSTGSMSRRATRRCSGTSSPGSTAAVSVFASATTCLRETSSRMVSGLASISLADCPAKPRGRTTRSPEPRLQESMCPVKTTSAKTSLLNTTGSRRRQGVHLQLNATSGTYDVTGNSPCNVTPRQARASARQASGVEDPFTPPWRERLAVQLSVVGGRFGAPEGRNRQDALSAASTISSCAPGLTLRSTVATVPRASITNVVRSLPK